MSPTSFQLLYSAILGVHPQVLEHYSTVAMLCQGVISAVFPLLLSNSVRIIVLFLFYPKNTKI